jgi:methylenetetrahydrofolate dehydrogenase (NADP+)/methenyltetrahydrofolate cyclohydrolase
MTRAMSGGAKIIDGKALAGRVRTALKDRVQAFEKARGTTPHLVVVLASEDPASAVYVRNKGKACEEVGIRSTQHKLAPTTSAKDLLDLIDKLNRDEDVDGILIQLPLPKQHDEKRVLRAIDPRKDVDGFHPVNAGMLARGDESGLVACTPQGCIRLIEEAGTSIEGKRALVIGRSNIVGRPMAELLLNRSATVSIAHSRTKELPERVRESDILIAAIGKLEMVKGSWIKPGATVIDVGMNKNAEGKLKGDVAFHAAREIAGAITPVPGGVGPMTIAYLLENTMKAAITRRGA